MIASLTGYVVPLGKSLTKPYNTLLGFQAGEVCYAIEAGPRGNLWVGQERMRIYIWHVIRETEQILYAFATAEERNLAMTISGIEGFGPKGSANAVHALGVTELMRYVIAGDAKGLQGAVKGIGAIGANRLVQHLKDNLIVTSDPPEAALVVDVVVALKSLGLQPTPLDIMRLQAANPTCTTAELIQKYLAK